jgi:hypothetical protein
MFPPYTMSPPFRGFFGAKRKGELKVKKLIKYNGKIVSLAKYTELAGVQQ